MKSGDKITLKSGFGLSDSAKSIYFPKVNLDFNANKKEVFEKKIIAEKKLIPIIPKIQSGAFSKNGIKGIPELKN